jgi:hypothetical protein
VIDFGEEAIPIETKYKKLKEPVIERSLKSFVEKYHPKEAWIINLSLDYETKINKTTFKFLPFYKLFI